MANTFSPITSSIKEITNKIQSSSIVMSIPPFVENVVNNGFNIHTDITSIVKAEEATEYPIKHKNTPIIHEFDSKNIQIDELQRKLEVYNQIGAQDFDDTILFKHTRRRKLQNSSEMAKSVSSLSSTSSDEKDCNVIRPTIMNLSTVGILPDLRSPDTIQNEIEEKEKLLADVLSLDKVKLDSSNLCDQSTAGESKETVVENQEHFLTEKVEKMPPINNVFDATSNKNIKESHVNGVSHGDVLDTVCNKTPYDSHVSEQNVCSNGSIGDYCFNSVSKVLENPITDANLPASYSNSVPVDLPGMF